MAWVYGCQPNQFDTQAMTCDAAAWIEVPDAQADLSWLFEMDPAANLAAFTACFGFVLLCNVTGYLVGVVVKSVSSDRH